MITESKLRKQRERLRQVTPQEWMSALDALTEEMRSSKLLGGHIENGPHNTKRLVNARTRFGAHSEYNLATSNVLYHYQTEFVLALYDGEWEWKWKADTSLADQLKQIANSRIPKAVDKYQRKKEKEEKEHIYTTPVSLDVNLMGKPDDYTGEETETLTVDNSCDEEQPDNASLDYRDAMAVCHSANESRYAEMLNDAESNDLMRREPPPTGMDYQHKLWEAMCDAAEGDKDLERFVQVTGECQKMQEVNDRLQLNDGDRDRLQKRLKNRVNKLNIEYGS